MTEVLEQMRKMETHEEATQGRVDAIKTTVKTLTRNGSLIGIVSAIFGVGFAWATMGSGLTQAKADIISNKSTAHQETEVVKSMLVDLKTDTGKRLDKIDNKLDRGTEGIARIEGYLGTQPAKKAP